MLFIALFRQDRRISLPGRIGRLPAVRFPALLRGGVAALLFGAAPVALAEQRISIRVDTYLVQGATTPELIEAIIGSVQGVPFDHGAASTTIRFRPELDYKQQGGECRLDEVAVFLDATLVLPRWNVPPDASPEARTAWARFEYYLRAHEEQHLSIATDFRALLETELAGLPPLPTCERLGALVLQTVAEVELLHEDAQAAFDAEERERSLSLGR